MHDEYVKILVNRYNSRRPCQNDEFWTSNLHFCVLQDHTLLRSALMKVNRKWGSSVGKSGSNRGKLLVAYWARKFEQTHNQILYLTKASNYCRNINFTHTITRSQMMVMPHILTLTSYGPNYDLDLDDDTPTLSSYSICLLGRLYWRVYDKFLKLVSTRLPDVVTVTANTTTTGHETKKWWLFLMVSQSNGIWCVNSSTPASKHAEMYRIQAMRATQIVNKCTDKRCSFRRQCERTPSLRWWSISGCWRGSYCAGYTFLYRG